MPGDIKLDLSCHRGLRSWSWRMLCFGLALNLGANGAESPKVPQPPDFRHLAPLPAMVEAAQAAGLKLDGFAPAGAEGAMRPGDSVTFLVSLTEGRRLKQWLFIFAMEQATEKERQRPLDVMRLYTTTGSELRFDGGRAAIRMTDIGPLEKSDAGTKAASAPAVRRQRILVNADYLALGMDRMVAMVLQLQALAATRAAHPQWNLNFDSRPFSPGVVATNRDPIRAAGITSADERSFIGSMLALKEFAMLGSRTPGMQEVFRSVVDIPWWSILTSGGKVDIGINLASGARELSTADWGLPAEQKVYASPASLTINNKPGLLYQLALTAPDAPLAVSAGIVGLAAGSPDGKGPVLTLELVASHIAPEPAKP